MRSESESNPLRQTQESLAPPGYSPISEYKYFPIRIIWKLKQLMSFILKAIHNNNYLIKIFEIELFVDGISFT